MGIKTESSIGSKDLHVVYRPYKLQYMLGNESNKRIIKNGLESGTLPHTLLFTGPAGCGKTTMARIIATGLNCKGSDNNPIVSPTADPCLKCESCTSIINNNGVDVIEVNVGQAGGKWDMADIIKDLPSSPFNSRYKVLIFDEAHKLTDAAQDLLLKPIEDGYEHVYYIFCTNHPDKLRTRKNKKEGEAFLDRCYAMHFGPLSSEDIFRLLAVVCSSEKVDGSQEVLQYLADESAGVPRKALRWLRQIIDDGTWDLKVAKTIVGTLIEEEDPQIIELCRCLNRAQFKKSVSIYDKVKNKGAETIRIPVALYFLACLKGSHTINEGNKFSAVLDIISTPIYESGKVGDIAMINNMYKIVATIKKFSK